MEIDRQGGAGFRGHFIERERRTWIGAEERGLHKEDPTDGFHFWQEPLES